MAKDSGSPLNFSPAPPGRFSHRRRKDPRRTPFADSPFLAWLLRLRSSLDFGRAALLIVTILSLSALFTLHFLPDKVSLRLGDISSKEIHSPRTVRYVDEDAMRLLRDSAASRVEPIYNPVPHASLEADQTIRDICAHLRHARGLHNPSPAHVADELRQQIGIVVPDPNLLAPIINDSADLYHLDQAERVMRDVVHTVMGSEIRDDHYEDLVHARDSVTSAVSASMLPRAYIPGITAIARAVIHPNWQWDRDRTEAARETERRLVAPQYGELFAGDIIVRHGQVVTPTVIDKLRALGMENPRLDPSVVACATLLVILMVLIVLIYLAQWQPMVFRSTKLLVLLSLLVVLSVLGLKLGGTLLGVRLSAAQYGYVGMFCVTAACMLIAALINARIAILVTALLSIQSGLMLGNDLRFTAMILISSLVGIYAVSDIRSRSDVLRAAVSLCVINVVLCTVIGRIEGDTWHDIFPLASWAVVSGLSSVALFFLGAVLFEKPFGITTHLSLLELSDPNRPLLQQFCQLAPGTYTHSIMVGNLAVAAAEAIGADALLCRVGAYYHDLGKMRRAEFFVENQGGGDNAHERLNPSLSALVVTAHVKDGLEIAEEEKLPPVVKAFITEHHGTSLVKYFYHQHTTSGEGLELTPGLEQHFRYAGPKPQSRETAILMLADGVEAASRTLEKPSVTRIENLVDLIINTQLTDGQLDECDITLRDLRGIRDAFVRLLAGMLHSRVEYPDLLKQSGYKTEKSGTFDKPEDSLVSITGSRDAADTSS